MTPIGVCFLCHIVVDEVVALVKLPKNNVAETTPPKITANKMNGYTQMNQNSEMV